jgi:hypothetical protein
VRPNPLAGRNLETLNAVEVIHSSVMKHYLSNIPLTFFAGAAAGVIGIAFCAAPLTVLAYNIRVHGFYSLMAMVDVTVAGIGIGVVALAAGVMLRRAWAHRWLVRSLVALWVVLVLAVARKLLQHDRPPADFRNDLVFGPFVAILIVVTWLFLINRRVREDLRPEPNKAPLDH